jgi:hypothetical protein
LRYCAYLFAIVLLIAATACEEKELREIAVEAPLAEFKVWGDEAYMEAVEGVQLEELVDVRPLSVAGLSPGGPIDEVRGILGKPDYQSTTRQGRDTVFGYRTANGNIEIIRQEVDSEEYEGVHWLTTYVPLREARPLHLAIENALHSAGELRSAVVMAGDHGADRAEISLRNHRIERIRWYRVDLSTPAGDPALVGTN